MNTLRPITIRAAQVTTSTIPYPDTGETAWSGSSVGYVLGDTVSYTVDGLIQKFECIVAHTSSATNYPVPYPNETVNWLDLGAANRYNMFHLERNTQSIETSSPLTVEINTGERVGMVAIGNIEANEVTLYVYDSSAALVYSETKDLINRTITGWFDYFYQPFLQVENTLFTNIPINITHTHKLTFTKVTGSVKVGSVVMGMPFKVGISRVGAQARRMNFSTIDRDFDGESKITIRRSIPKTSQEVVIDKSNLNSVAKLVDDLNGVVTVWTALTDPTDGFFNTFFIIGYYRDVTYNAQHPRHCISTFELEAI